LPQLQKLASGQVLTESSGPGQGSEFVVRLPLARNEPRRAEKEGRQPDQTLVPRRILVVDDNVDGATSLSTLLRIEGHEVRIAHDGQTALEVAKGFQPQIAILDIRMPGMDGYELARRLRQQVGLQNMSLVALSGYGQREDQLRSEQAGFNHHVTKPVDLKRLNALIASFSQEGE